MEAHTSMIDDLPKPVNILGVKPFSNLAGRKAHAQATIRAAQGAAEKHFDLVSLPQVGQVFEAMGRKWQVTYTNLGKRRFTIESVVVLDLEKTTIGGDKPNDEGNDTL